MIFVTFMEKEIDDFRQACQGAFRNKGNDMTTKRISGDKTYIMDLSNGRLRRITVPASWKVTFGPLVPKPSGDDRYQNKTFALRFYESKDQQRAIFTDVLSFRDESLKVEERVTKTKQKMVHKNAPGGKREMVVEARVTEWRDPLAPEGNSADASFLAITDETKDF